MTAIDTSDPLLARLEAKIRQFGIGNIDVHNMPAGRLDFRRDYFPAVACSLAWHEPPALLSAAREWWWVLRPGGRTVCSVYGRNAFQPFADQLRASLIRLGTEPAELPWLALAEPDVVVGVLQAAGFGSVNAEPVRFGYHLPDAAAWWQVVMFGPLRAFLITLDEARQRELRELHLAELEPHIAPDGLWLDVPVLIACGSKALD